MSTNGTGSKPELMWCWVRAVGSDGGVDGGVDDGVGDCDFDGDGGCDGACVLYISEIGRSV